MIASKSSKHFVTAAHVLAWIALGLWMFYIYLFFQYDATRPTVPQPAVGRTYDSNNHGHVVYLDWKEEETLDSIQIGAFVLFGVAALMGYHSEHPKRLGEIRNGSWLFFCSLLTAAGWSEVGQVIGQEGKSIAESLIGVLAGPDKIAIHSNSSVDNCRTELQKHVYLNAANISGDVDGDRIHLFIVHKELSNSFSPHFYGKLQARPPGTMVEGRFTMARFVMVFCGIWFAGIGAAMFIVTPPAVEALVGGQPAQNAAVGAFFPPFLLVFGLLILHWGYRFGCSDKTHMVKFLQRTLNAKP